MKYHLSRKYILALLSLASATGLVAFGRIGEGVYSQIIIATVGLYIAGNVYGAKKDVQSA